GDADDTRQEILREAAEYAERQRLANSLLPYPHNLGRLARLTGAQAGRTAMPGGLIGLGYGAAHDRPVYGTLRGLGRAAATGLGGGLGHIVGAAVPWSPAARPGPPVAARVLRPAQPAGRLPEPMPHACGMGSRNSRACPLHGGGRTDGDESDTAAPARGARARAIRFSAPPTSPILIL